MQHGESLMALPYAGPIAFYILLTQCERVLFEKHEHFPKATTRNRCHIAGPDGVVRLTVPILHGRSHHQAMHDVQISYDHDWQKQHWKSLESAYRRSPYFEFYEDDLRPSLETKHHKLLDLNMAVHKFICKCLGLEPKEAFTESYEEHPDIADYRATLPQQASTPRYNQVFEDRHGFIPNLSALDLLFNEGPNAGKLIRAASQ